MTRSAPLQTRLAVPLIGLLCALLYANWAFAIARFQPNVLFHDQWDFLSPLFNGGGPWSRFLIQQGPPREGLGLVLTGWILEATRWDVRYDSLWIATVLLAAVLLALRLVRKMTGSVRLRDAWIAVVGLSLAQFETALTVPNVSHSAMPLALLMLAANVWLHPRPSIRYIGAALIAIASIFTGFGLFAGAGVSVLLAARVIRHARDVDYRALWPAVAGAVTTAGGWIWFSVDYVFAPAVDNFRFPWTPWTDYVSFVVLMFDLPVGYIGTAPRHYILGGALLLAVVITAAAILWLWARRFSLEDDVLVLLMGSSLMFVVATAIGRVSLGVTAGTTSRYFTLMIPLWLAGYLLAATTYRRVFPLAGLCVWLLAVVPYGAMLNRPIAEWPGTAGLTNSQTYVMRFYAENKAGWARTFLETGRTEAAQAAVRQPIYPNPGATNLDRKLQFLREHKLSFFAGDYLPWSAEDRFDCPAFRSPPPSCR